MGYNCSKCPGYCCSYPVIPLTKKDVQRLADGIEVVAVDVAVDDATAVVRLQGCRQRQQRQRKSCAAPRRDGRIDQQDVARVSGHGNIGDAQPSLTSASLSLMNSRSATTLV